MLKADVEVRPDRILIDPDGIKRDDTEVFITEEQYRRMRQGYMCPWCYQPLKHAFELTCASWHWGPRNPSQQEWQQFMDEEYGGVVWFGPSKATLNHLENTADRESHVKKTQILVPGRDF